MNPAGVRLEPFRWWHIDEVLPIEADLFGVEQWSPAMFWNELANGHFYLVATDAGDATDSTGATDLTGAATAMTAANATTPVRAGKVLGYAGLTVAAPDEAWVQNIAVRRDAQRRGVGRALLEALLAEAARRGARSTLLEVAADNAPAQRLYAAYGFEPIGVRRGYYQPSNTDALVMRREQD
ncbi:ribosomal-protein-alanine N-acetyltransferase [Micromonospora sp. MW-13]|uniref:ribosomal protein S18-alanine N-acetyltransferase n=1 Tax=Micromonospora sp. MW-13 TaxID=2094022 RepID=UPI000EE298AA|nr:ribosomal protein S18-alanine N-acetyltransferase [Micromonospora sp. MW-13]RGC70697.1 ribosomal-protein-alanine N-acetyltransferase [Micromonospora sp. MW-13]